MSVSCEATELTKNPAIIRGAQRWWWFCGHAHCQNWCKITLRINLRITTLNSPIFTVHTRIECKWRIEVVLGCISRKNKSWGALCLCSQPYWGVPSDDPLDASVLQGVWCLLLEDSVDLQVQEPEPLVLQLEQCRPWVAQQQLGVQDGLCQWGWGLCRQEVLGVLLSLSVWVFSESWFDVFICCVGQIYIILGVIKPIDVPEVSKYNRTFLEHNFIEINTTSDLI